MNSNVDQFLSHDPAEVTCDNTLTATFCYVMQSLVLNFMNFILFQLKLLKFKSKIKFTKFELHNYGFYIYGKNTTDVFRSWKTLFYELKERKFITLQVNTQTL